MNSIIANIHLVIDTFASNYPEVLSKYLMAIAMVRMKFVNIPQHFNSQMIHSYQSFFLLLLTFTSFLLMSKMNYQTH